MEIIKLEKFMSIIYQKLETWMEEGVKMLPNFVVSVVVLILFWILSNLAVKLAGKMLHRMIHSREVINLLLSLIKVFVVCCGMFIALDFIGLQGTVSSLLAGAGIVGLAIGFAFQDMTENFISGVTMSVRKPFKIGDIIETDSIFGSVNAINLRNTIVENFSGQIKIIPNKILFQNILTNYSATKVRKISIPVGISYGDDPDEAAKIIVDAINQFDFVIDKESTAVYADGFGASSIDLLVWFWIDYPGEHGYMLAKHDAICTIHKSLNEAGIQIPFPIRTLDFGIKGGKTLAEMNSETSLTDKGN
ncbi:mechanosensitive ion channel family protein [Vibrio sp.]|nr:mechanosensitive ion channel family protein [Vibrio sp.]